MNAPGIKSGMRVKAAGYHLLREICVPDKITLITGFRGGEPLLKALHNVFIE
ncbi:MAG: hypothetical protein Q8O90_05735 [Elusimicrobiota bacterium]|nr:hypothetical protein [Elusimicrobiota bacterium]